MLQSEITNAHYLRMPAGPIAQGDIWSGLPSIYPSDRHSLGMVITPRCDLAHDKAPVVNYLPLTPFHDHFVYEGGLELIAQECKGAADLVASRAKEIGIDMLLDGGVELSEALRVAQSQMEESSWMSSKVRARVEQLRTAIQRHDHLVILAARHSISAEELSSYVSEKAVRKAKRAVARNTIVDLHFLPPCGPLFAEPMLVQLRSVASIPRDAIEAAARSWNDATWQKARDHLPPHIASVMASTPTRLVRLRSPYLEALMSRFGALFARVGTRDIPEAALSAMTEQRRSL